MSSTRLETMDTLTRKLTQAQSVLAALEATGEEDNQFNLRHADVMATIWAVRDLLDDAQRAVAGLSPGR